MAAQPAAGHCLKVLAALRNVEAGVDAGVGNGLGKRMLAAALGTPRQKQHLLGRRLIMAGLVFREGSV